MMKPLLIAFFLLAATPCLAQAPIEPEMSAPHYSVQASTLGELLENPLTKAIFERYFPEVAHHPQLDQGLGLTLPEVVQYLPDVVTPPKLAAMDAELKALP